MFFTMSSITLAVFVLRFFIFPFYESPKFLLSKGNDGAAVDVVRKIAAFNKRNCDLTVESLYKQCEETPMAEETKLSKRIFSEFSRLKLLFGSWRMTRVMIVVCITWMFDWWGETLLACRVFVSPDFIGFSIISTYIPTILQRKNSAIDVGVHETYIDYLISYTPGFVAASLAIFMVRAPTVGRKWTMVLSSMLMGVSLFLYSIVNTEASHVGVNLLVYFFQTLFNAVVSSFLLLLSFNQ